MFVWYCFLNNNCVFDIIYCFILYFSIYSFAVPRKIRGFLQLILRNDFTFSHLKPVSKSILKPFSDWTLPEQLCNKMGCPQYLA